MIKNKKKISFLDYSILFVSLIFFSIVYFYSQIIWPREEMFKDTDRSRMERIDDAQRLYNVLTGDYIEDPATLFALIEAIKDTLDGDEFFEGKKDIVLANKYERYVIKDIFGKVDNNDTILVKTSEVQSFQFSEGIKLYSKYIQSKIDSSLSIEEIQNRLIDNLVDYTTNRNSVGSDTISWKEFIYTMDEKDKVITDNIYPFGGYFYKNFIDGQVLDEVDLSNLTYTVDIPPGFKNRLDTTFTNPVKVEEKYKEMIYAVRVMNFDPTDNFLDIGNNKWNFAEEFTDANDNEIWDIAEVFTENNGRYDIGEEFIDANVNGKWDPSDTFEDEKNGRYDIGEYFKDVKNGKYDEGEEFTDKGNGVWDSIEDFFDLGNGKYDEGEEFIDINDNGKWDSAEKFSDINDNDIWDNAEPFIDNVNCNGDWDSAEDFFDLGNGKYDMGEQFQDAKNGIWDNAERLVYDLNSNGIYNQGDIYEDINLNDIWDPAEKFQDKPNGRYDIGEEFTDGNGKWDKEEKLIKDFNGNRKWDPAEEFTDANGKYNIGEDFLDCTWLKGKRVCNDAWWRKFIANNVWDNAETFIDNNGNGIWDSAEQYSDSNNNNKYDEGEEFVDKGNGVHDFGEIYYDINYLNSHLHDQYKSKESYLGYLPNQDTLYIIFDSSLDKNITVPSYEFKKNYKDEELIKDLDYKIESIDYKIVERKRVYMDYLSNSDTLTVDSLYSAINSFKNNYSQKDLFKIEITRFEDEFYFMNLQDNWFPSCSVIYPDEFPANQGEAIFYQEVEVFLPFINKKTQAVLYFSKLDNPSIVISSPVPQNQYWTYWHKLYSIDIDNIKNNKYSKSTFNVPTPFSFYTGDPGHIIGHSKSWTD